MTVLISLSVLNDYFKQLSAHGVWAREAATGYFAHLTNEVERQAASPQDADEEWHLHPQEDLPDPFKDSPYDPKFPADLTLRFVRGVSFLGYDPSGFAQYHFQKASERLKSLAPPIRERDPFFEACRLPKSDIHVELTDPIDDFDTPPRRYNDPSP